MGSEGVGLIAGWNRRPDCNPIRSEAFHEWADFQIHDETNTTVVFKPSDRPLARGGASREDSAGHRDVAVGRLEFQDSRRPP
jgi:hypothetical protein